MTSPPPPRPAPPPAPTHPAERAELWGLVRKAIEALPSFFESDLDVTGVLASDLFTFNSSLGATIEQQVVEQLNKLRATWDPQSKWATYRFERQSQRFPDVILREPGQDPILGIELKGWYVLAKEREPSFRFEVTPQACDPFDLLVVVPWALERVVSGSPQVFDPFVVSARYAAEVKNWFWRYGRVTTADTTVRLSAHIGSYPTKSAQILDRARSDGGNNFGCVARTGLMDEYMTNVFAQSLLGIPIDAWQRFFRVFAENRDFDGKLKAALESIKRTKPNLAPADRADIAQALHTVASALE